MMNGLGVAAGLATAILWTATAICFEVSGRRLGSLTVNVLRLVIAALLFLALSLVRTHTLLPPGLSLGAWRDLGLSGFVGFVLGDLMLFQAFVLIGARLSMLIYATVPAMTAIGGYLFLGEVLGARVTSGMAVTAAGIAMAVLGGRRHTNAAPTNRRRLGVVLALGGSAGQAAGLLLGKVGSRGIDAFAATQIRVLVALVGFAALVLVLGQTKTVLRPLACLLPQGDRATRLTLALLTLGAVLGPFLGVSLGLLSAQLLPAGVASTLMSLEPILLVPAAIVLFHERVTIREWVGTFVALAGVAILAL